MYRLWEGHQEALGQFASTELWRRFAHRFLTFAAPVEVDRVLNVACGSGLLLPFLSDRGKSVHGADVTPPSQPYDSVTHHVRCEDDALPYAERSFSLICSAFMSPDEGDLARLTQLLQPGGTIAFMVPSASLDPQTLLADPSMLALPSEARTLVERFLTRVAPHGLTDVQVARWFVDARLIAVRTAPIADGSFLMAKARRA